MTYSKEDIVKFQDPWLNLSWIGKRLNVLDPTGSIRKQKYIITGYMNQSHLNKIASKQPNEIILTETLEIHNNELFIVQEYFSGPLGGNYIVVKEFDSKTNLQYLVTNTIIGDFIILTDVEKAQLMRDTRKQKIKKIIGV